MNLVNLKGYCGNLLFLGMRFLTQPNAGMEMLGGITLSIITNQTWE